MKPFFTKEEVYNSPAIITPLYTLNFLFTESVKSINIVTIIESELHIDYKLAILFGYCKLTDEEKESLSLSLLKTLFTFMEKDSRESLFAASCLTNYEKCKKREYLASDLETEIDNLVDCIFEEDFEEFKSCVLWSVVYFIRDSSYKRTDGGLSECIESSNQEQLFLTMIADFCKERLN